MIGSILGNRYRVLRELGSGGMAWVYLAEDIAEGTYVAVKILYPQYSQDAAYLQRFVREAHVAFELTDPHIVKVLDYGSSRDIHYIVMEYIAGLDLKAVLAARGKLTWAEALAVARQVAQAIEQADRFGIVHRDIKPQNLMVTDDGTVKVLDFGIARLPAMPALTQSGLLGSPYYISPEQAMGEDVDARSDLYSLGIVLFEMLTGHPPFVADNAWSIISQHIADEPPRLSDVAEGIPPGVGQIVSVVLEKNKDDRFSSPGDLIQAIDTVAAGGTLPNRALPGCASPEERDRLLEELYAEAMTATVNEQYEKAIHDLSRVLRLSPGYRDADAQLDSVLGAFRLEELYTAASSAVQDESWARALLALRELAAISPGYKDTASLLVRVLAGLGNPPDTASPEPVKGAEEGAESFGMVQLSPEEDSTPTIAYPMETHGLDEIAPPQVASAGRWSRRLVTVLVAIVVFGGGLYGYIAFAGRPGISLDDRYHRAMVLYNQGRWTDAVKEFERIMAVAPDFEDAAFRKVEAGKFRELDRLYGEAQTEYRQGHWADAITLLTQVRAEDLTFREASVTGLLCDAYDREARTLSEPDSPQALQSTVSLLNQALDVCAADTNILSLKQWAEDYIQASVDLEAGQSEKSIDRLNAMESLDPSTSDERLGRLLFQAYMQLGTQRESSGEFPQALDAYEHAMAVPGIEHSVAEEQRARLAGALVTVAPSPTVSVAQASPTHTTPTPEPTRAAPPAPTVWRYKPPQPFSPETGQVFTSGEFEKIVLEWLGPEKLASGEYYDVSILHFENGEPVYWGTNTTDSRMELSPDIGFGKADKDVFHWFVTVRQTQRLNDDGKPDGPPVSPKSQAWTFYWR